MYRSNSTSRFSDDQYSYYSSSSPSAKVPTALRAMSVSESQGLPMYEPMSEAAKKEKARANFAEKAVHAIPLLLLLCLFILWIFSDSDIDVGATSLAEKVHGMATTGDFASDGTGHFPLHLGDLPHPA